ncbi:MAG: nucleoside phosphorylase [Tannerella sp.]|jgi:uridine phosphorylase|nr:nucleoside phosphorylase [Tannerella sp.]
MKPLPPSELIINDDGSIFHLHLRPEQLADRVILVGDPARVDSIAARMTDIECDVVNREFHSATGSYRGKRITVVSHGIGCDNLDIVMNELDALANIDFATRTVCPVFRRLTLVRIGTSGGLQPYTPIGTYVAAVRSVGLDGVIYFYKDSEAVRDTDMENALMSRLRWDVEGVRPYVVSADSSLLEQVAQDDIVRGITIAANGFYAPQGRELRLHLHSPTLNDRIKEFEYQGLNVTNYEMESSALAGLAALMGHRALTVCCIIAGRADHRMNTSYKGSMSDLIDRVLNRI